MSYPAQTAEEKIAHLHKLREEGLKGVKDPCPNCGQPRRMAQAHRDRRAAGVCAACFNYVARNQRTTPGGYTYWRRRSHAQSTPYDSR